VKLQCHVLLCDQIQLHRRQRIEPIDGHPGLIRLLCQAGKMRDQLGLLGGLGPPLLPDLASGGQTHPNLGHRASEALRLHDLLAPLLHLRPQSPD
jgi:hypothetical protein